MASIPGANYLIRDHHQLLLSERLAVCNSSNRTFDLGTVEILDSSEECTGFRCPACQGRHDDRRAPSGQSNRRMGYTELRVKREAL